MTSLDARAGSLVEKEDSRAENAIEMAAARAEVRATHLLRRSFKLSCLTQKELAEKLSLSEGRVSQVLNSDGNVKTTTLARFLRALGYRLVLEAEPIEGHTPDLRRHGKQRKRSSQSVHVYGPIDGDIKETVVLSVRSDLHSSGALPLQYQGQTSVPSSRSYGNLGHPVRPTIGSTMVGKLGKGEKEQ